MNTFKKHLDKWLRGIPDTPKIDDYGVTVGAETNCITKKKKTTGDPVCEVAMSLHEETKFLMIIIIMFYHISKL